MVWLGQFTMLGYKIGLQDAVAIDENQIISPCLGNGFVDYRGTTKTDILLPNMEDRNRRRFRRGAHHFGRGWARPIIGHNDFKATVRLADKRL
ncbi:hypothetical protein A9K71_22350 [Mesorhizobium sp. WSM3873]|nr:hypothetical protein A9K71_22350 [Mesorhizobium sp. WSM3873]